MLLSMYMFVKSNDDKVTLLSYTKDLKHSGLQQNMLNHWKMLAKCHDPSSVVGHFDQLYPNVGNCKWTYFVDEIISFNLTCCLLLTFAY